MSQAIDAVHIVVELQPQIHANMSRARSANLIISMNHVCIIWTENTDRPGNMRIDGCSDEEETNSNTIYNIPTVSARRLSKLMTQTVNSFQFKCKRKNVLLVSE